MIKKIDMIPNFNQTMFESKANNILTKILLVKTLEDLSNIKHFLSNQYYQKLANKIKVENSNNQITLHENIELTNTNIYAIEENDNEYIVRVLIEARYTEYLYDKVKKSVIDGNKYLQIDTKNYLTFRRLKNIIGINKVFSCPNCGSNIDYNNSGICPYCKQSENLVSYDWILSNIITGEV